MDIGSPMRGGKPTHNNSDPILEEEVRVIALSVAILGSVILASPRPAHAICVMGIGDCPPSDAEAKTAVIRNLAGKLRPPYSVVSFRKTNGAQGPFPNLYEIRYVVVLSYPDDGIKCNMPLCPELSTYRVKVDKAKKTVTISGVQMMQKTENGWR